MDSILTENTAIELLSLNTNGIREDRKRQSLFNWLKKTHNAENKIIFLQETHTDTENEQQWIDDWGHRKISFAHGTNRSKGVAIIMPNSLDYKVINTELDPNGRYIVMQISIDTINFVLINCYSPTANFSTQQLEWLTKIQEILEKYSEMNLIIGGDLNDYFTPHLDKYNAPKNLAETDYINAWKVICNDLNLTDIWRTLNPELRRYTWRQGKTKNTLKQSRLDYWLISTHMIHDLTEVDIEPGFRSDHSLIKITFKSHKQSERGPSYWRFNSNLLKNTDYVTYMNTRIDEIIEKHRNIENAGLKWDVIKMEIRSSTVCFSKKLSKSKKDHINEVIIENSRLNKLLDDKPDDDTLKCYEATKLEIELFNNEKANGVLLRSKVNWAELGERNTKYFLNLEKRNYKNKCITKLIDEKEQTIEDSEGILIYEAKYYNTLYTDPKLTPNEEDNDGFLNDSNNKLCEDSKELCEQEININEVGIALKELKNGKSPGTDGFTADFYKFFWVKINNLVLESLQQAYIMGELSI